MGAANGFNTPRSSYVGRQACLEEVYLFENKASRY